MSRLAPWLVLVVVAVGGCGSKRLADSRTGTAGAAAGTGGSASGGSSGGAPAGAGGNATTGTGGPTTGTGGGAIGGAAAGAGGSATAGSAGGAAAGASGGAAAGANGGAAAGASGGAAAGASGGAAAGANGGAAGGTSGGAAGGSGSGGAAAGAGGGDGPIRLVIFFTRWGTSYPEWFPIGSDRSFTMSAMLQPLEAHKSDLVVVSGLTNATVRTAASGPALSAAAAMNGASPDEAMTSLLTARPGATGGPAQGPSLDTVVGNCGGAAGAPLLLTVGQFGFEAGAGVSFAADGERIRGEANPHTVAMRLLGHDVTAPNPGDSINASYPALGAAQMAIATEALATSKTCAVTLMWGDQVQPTWLGLSDLIHDLSRSTNGTYAGVATTNPASNPSGGFQQLQRWYAQQFASLLDALQATPLAHGTLLDRSVVIWVSDTGAGSDDLGYYIPVVIAGGGGGRLDRGRVLDLKPHTPPTGQFIDYQSIARTQGDLLAALGSLWGMTTFGDPQITRQPLTEILLP